MIDPHELLYSVDKANNPITPQPRALSHQVGIWHRSCHVWVINDQNEILCQQRSVLKDSNPGLWEPFFGGHLAPEQSYAQAAISEVREELGLHVTEDDLQFWQEYRYTPGTEFQGVFLLRWSGDSATLHLEEEEVQQIVWESAKEVKHKTVSQKDKQWTSIGYESELLKLLGV